MQEKLQLLGRQGKGAEHWGQQVYDQEETLMSVGIYCTKLCPKLLHREL